jgi:hypothetical protein
MTALDRFRGTVAYGDAFIVDAAGNIHATSWLAYAEMPSEALQGCHVFGSTEAATRCAARIWRKRQEWS